MKFVRVKTGEEVFYGLLEDNYVRIINGNIFSGEYKITDRLLPLKKVTILAPCQPGKAICVGLNYRAHAQEVGFTLPDGLLVFLKASSALNHPGGEIIYPEATAHLEFEGELAIVIGKEAKNIKAADAYRYILGYTCANDVTARDIQKSESQWMRSKSFDSFMPLGPCIATEIDPNNVFVRSYQNGQIRQDSSTALLIYDIAKIVEFVSKSMTLNPGDVILTGSPKGTTPMQVGDRIEVEIDGIGRLSNTVIDGRCIEGNYENMCKSPMD